MVNKDYTNLGSSPYDKLLNRQGDLVYRFGRGSDDSNQDSFYTGNNDGTTQTKGGSVSTVALKSEGNATDVWIQNFIRSVNWKPKTVGFYIDGATGYAEFANIFVSGTIVVNSGSIGGFVIGEDSITDEGDTMGMSSTITGGDDVRFWAGSTYTNRNTAPFRVTENGVVYATNAVITGGTIQGTTIVNSNGTTDPTFTPSSIGQLYINTALGRCFIAIGINSDADWLLISTTAVPRNISEYEDVLVSENINLTII